MALCVVFILNNLKCHQVIPQNKKNHSLRKLRNYVQNFTKQRTTL